MIINTILVTGDNIEMINSVPVASLFCWLPRRNMAQRNTMVSGWELPEMGRMWYNTTTQQVELWDGNRVRIVG